MVVEVHLGSIRTVDLGPVIQNDRELANQLKTLVYNAFKPVPDVKMPLNFGSNRGVVSDQDLVTPIQQLHNSTNHGSYIWARKVTQETVLLCRLALKSTLEAQSMPK